MSAEATPRASSREWVGLAVLALACVVYAMDLTVLHLAVPSLSADLQPTSVQLLWIIDIYGFMVAGALITMGTLGDRIGRRRLLLFGAVAFGLASLLTAFSTSPEMLIASRALLGIAGATIAPSTLSLIRSMFHDPSQRTFAIGVWVTAYSLGGALGPLLGGVLLEFFWWGSVFLLAVPVMVLLLILGPIVLPEYRDPNPGRLDVVSAAMSLVAVLAVVYGLKQLAQDGLGNVADPLDRCRARDRPRLRAATDEARRSAHRPAALPGAGVQRVARRVHARDPGHLRRLPLHLPVPPARGRTVAFPGRAVDAALIRRVHRRLDAHPGAREAGAPGLRDGCGARDRRRSASRS